MRLASCIILAVGFAGCGAEQDTRPEPGGLLDEDRGPRLFAIGAYIGELIRRNSDGWEWVPAKDDPDDELNLSLRRGAEVIWPIQRAIKRYRNGGEDGIAGYVASVVAG